MINKDEDCAGVNERAAKPDLSMPRVVSNLRLLLAARRSARNAQRLERVAQRKDELAA
ncbi:MAG TPA: hypothetical protein VFG86_04565 [Chloroflexota bacterium]|jgi:hypothetical protein|nr:hypothetical protein [Chloroflexota bacterium]